MTLKKLSRLMLSLFVFFIFSAPVFGAAEKAVLRHFDHWGAGELPSMHGLRYLTDVFIEAVDAYRMGEEGNNSKIYGACINLVIGGQLRTIELDFKSLDAQITSAIADKSFNLQEERYQDLFLKQFEEQLENLVFEKADLFSDQTFVYPAYKGAGFLYLKPLDDSVLKIKKAKHLLLITKKFANQTENLKPCV